MLDELLAVDNQERQLGVRMIQGIAGIHGNPIDSVSDSVLLEWCKQQPETRYQTLASVISALTSSSEWQPVQWTTIGRGLLAEAPDRVAVLHQIIQRFGLTSWRGSLSATMEARVDLLRERETHHDPNVVKYVHRELHRLRHQIEEEKRRETQMHKATDERFE
jgi:hypothetical protein